MRHAERGQAMAETAIFLPVALMVLFGILYFARFGVLKERAQSAVRYAARISYESAPTYSAADIYNAIAANGIPAPGCASTVSGDTIGVLDGPGAPSSVGAYWQPDHPPSATCSVTTASFGGASWAAFHYFTVTQHTVTGLLDVPSYVTSALGTSGTVSASLGYLHADPPSMIMYCVNGLGSTVAAALNATYTASGSC